MLKHIALATLTAALVASPSLGHAHTGSNGNNINGIALNGLNNNGIQLNGIALNGLNNNGIQLNGIALNGLNNNGIQLNGRTVNGVEPAGREVYVIGEQAGGESSTVLTIELPRVTR